MAVGDGVDRDYRYEFKGFVFGAGTDFQVESLEGLLGVPSARTSDEERQEDHGDHAGVDLIPSRTLTGMMNILGTSADIQGKLDQATFAFQPSKRAAFIEYEFVTQRPGHTKRFVWARPRRCEFPSNYDTARGKAKGGFQLQATDPRWYSLLEESRNNNIATGTTNKQRDVTMAGNFADGVWPTIEIDGPATNPRYQNVTDGGRTIRIDIEVPAGQTLVIDTRLRTVFLNGVDRFDAVRADNQWWVLLPGNNTVLYSRTDNGTGSNSRIKWRDGWVSA